MRKINSCSQLYVTEDCVTCSTKRLSALPSKGTFRCIGYRMFPCIDHLAPSWSSHDLFLEPDLARVYLESSGQFFSCVSM